MERNAFLSSLSCLLPLQGNWSTDAKVLLGDSYSNNFVLSIETTDNQVIFFDDPKDPALCSIEIATDYSCVYFKMEDVTYLVDLNQIVENKILPEAFDDHEEFRKVVKPPSWILRFDDVVFRIFRNSCMDTHVDKDVLTAVSQRFLQMDSTVFQAMSPDRSVGSSTTGTPPNPSNSSRTEDLGSPKKRRASGEQPHPKKMHLNSGSCLESLRAIQTVLDMPVSAIDPKDLNLGQMLTKSAKLQKLSFVSSAELDAAHERLNKDLQDEALDALLDRFFPTRSKGNHNTELPDNQSISQEFDQLLKKHQEVIEKQHDLLLLPTRDNQCMKKTD